MILIKEIGSDCFVLSRTDGKVVFAKPEEHGTHVIKWVCNPVST